MVFLLEHAAWRFAAGRAGIIRPSRPSAKSAARFSQRHRRRFSNSVSNAGAPPPPPPGRGLLTEAALQLGWPGGSIPRSYSPARRNGPLAFRRLAFARSSGGPSRARRRRGPPGPADQGVRSVRQVIIHLLKTDLRGPPPPPPPPRAKPAPAWPQPDFLRIPFAACPRRLKAAARSSVAIARAPSGAASPARHTTIGPGHPPRPAARPPLRPCCAAWTPVVSVPCTLPAGLDLRRVSPSGGPFCVDHPPEKNTTRDAAPGHAGRSAPFPPHRRPLAGAPQRAHPGTRSAVRTARSRGQRGPPHRPPFAPRPGRLLAHDSRPLSGRDIIVPRLLPLRGRGASPNPNDKWGGGGAPDAPSGHAQLLAFISCLVCPSPPTKCHSRHCFGCDACLFPSARPPPAVFLPLDGPRRFELVPVKWAQPPFVRGQMGELHSPLGPTWQREIFGSSSRGSRQLVFSNLDLRVGSPPWRPQRGDPRYCRFDRLLARRDDAPPLPEVDRLIGGQQGWDRYTTRGFSRCSACDAGRHDGGREHILGRRAPLKRRGFSAPDSADRAPNSGSDILVALSRFSSLEEAADL